MLVLRVKELKVLTPEGYLCQFSTFSSINELCLYLGSFFFLNLSGQFFLEFKILLWSLEKFLKFPGDCYETKEDLRS